MNQRISAQSTVEQQLVGLFAGGNPCQGYGSSFDWAALIDLAKENGVSQMLYTLVMAQGLASPDAISERLRSIHLSGVVDGARRHHQFDKILEALTTAGVIVIPVKGAWLSESVYPNIAMRGMSDIDLWIQKEDVLRSIEAMESIGYEVSRSNSERPQELQDALLGETLLYKNGAPFVELHWSIFAGEWLRHTACIDERLLWERSLPWKSRMVRQLQPEDAVIHVAVHLAVNHHLSDALLRTLIDLQMMRKSLTIDWNLVMDRAVIWRVAIPVWLVVNALVHLFGDDCDVSDALDKVRPSKIRRWFLTGLFSPSPQRVLTGNKINGFFKFAFLMLLVDRPISALRLARQAVWPDRTWFTLRYGLSDAPFWRVAFQRWLHPLRVIWYRKP